MAATSFQVVVENDKVSPEYPLLQAMECVFRGLHDSH